MADPQKAAQLRARWLMQKERERQRDPDVFKARQVQYNRTWRARKLSTAEGRREWLENQRIYTAILRERKTGVAFKRAGGGRIKLKEIDPRLPVEPIRSWVQAKVKQYGSQERAASKCGVPGRTLHRVLHETSWVDLSLVDKMLTREGSTLFHELYPAFA
jgi:hypothetical protein